MRVGPKALQGLGLPAALRPFTSNKGVGAWTPARLFGANDNGAYFLPFDVTTVYTSVLATGPARDYESVKAIRDLSGKGHNATCAVADSTIRLFRDVATSTRYIRQSMEAAAARLTAAFGGSLGTDCTVVFANHTTVEFRTGQTIGSSYEIPKSFRAALIISRALTADETAQVRANFSAYCAAYVDAFDFHASASGSDSNDGLTEATPKTIVGGFAQLLASPTGARLAVHGGTEAAQIDTTGTANAKTHHIHFLAPTVFDKSENPDGSGGTSSAFGVGATGYTLKVYGEGNLTVQNYGNNGFGTSGSGVGELHDARMSACNDGLTSHATSTLRAYGVTADGCMKGAFTHTGNAATTYHEGCVFYAKVGSILGIGLCGEKGVNFDFFQSEFLPDPAAPTNFAVMAISSNDANAGSATARTIRSCRFGAPHLAPPATSIGACGFTQTEITDTYFNGAYVQPQANANTVSFIRCFGPKFTFRPRRTATSITNLDNCCFTGASINAHILDANFYSSPADVFGSGRVRNCIIKGATVGIYVTSNATEFNATWGLENNCFHSNPTNMTVGLTADGTDVLANPLLLNPTTDMPADWYVAANSPCVGAGVSGANVGIGVAA